MRSLRALTLTLLALPVAAQPAPLPASELDPAAATTHGATDLGQPRQLADRFGSALAAGDFDCDGRRDLAIGMPYRNVAGITDAGQVIVQAGPIGPTPPPGTGGVQILARGGNAQVFAYFGASLAAGDLDLDGCDDLVVGEPGFLSTRGAAHLYRGGSTGLTYVRGFLGSAAGAYYGAAATVLPRGTLLPVLAVGEPGWARSGVDLAGRVLLYFDALGTAASSSVACTAEAIRGRCGMTLATGIFTGGPVVFAGAPDAETIAMITVDPDGDVGRLVLPAPAGEGYTSFGAVFDAVDVDGDGFDSEIVLGQPDATVNGRPGAGRLALLRFGVGIRLATVWNRHQAQFGFSAEAGDRFGSMVRRFDLDGNERMDVVVGTEKEASAPGRRQAALSCCARTGISS